VTASIKGIDSHTVVRMEYIPALRSEKRDVAGSKKIYERE